MRPFLGTDKFIGMLCILALTIISCSTSVLAADVNLSWLPNAESDLAGYKVYYGAASHNYGSPVVIGLQATYTVTGLSNGTYYFAVKAYDTSGNESGFSNEVSKTISGVTDTTPPSISNILTSNISNVSMTISWTTSENSDTQVEYGATAAYGSSTPVVPTLVSSHIVQLSGLQSSTGYHFRVKSRDTAGNLATSADFTASTLLPSPTNVTVK
jgi:predicted phage tail protein